MGTDKQVNFIQRVMPQEWLVGISFVGCKTNLKDRWEPECLHAVVRLINQLMAEARHTNDTTICHWVFGDCKCQREWGKSRGQILCLKVRKNPEGQFVFSHVYIYIYIVYIYIYIYISNMMCCWRNDVNATHRNNLLEWHSVLLWWTVRRPTPRFSLWTDLSRNSHLAQDEVYLLCLVSHLLLSEFKTFSASCTIHDPQR